MNEMPSRDQELLFREEALRSRQTTWLGELVFIRPVSFRLMTWFAVCVISVGGLFVYFGTYTKRNTVTGQIVPAEGVVRIFPPQVGVILEANIRDGDRIRKGQKLFVVSSDPTNSIGQTQALVSSSIEARTGLLHNKISALRSLSVEDKVGLERKIAEYRVQITQIGIMIETQSKHVAVAQDMKNRYQQLLSQQFVSEADVENREADLLDQQSRLTSLQKDLSDAKIGLSAAENDLRDLPLKTYDNVIDVQGDLQSANADLSTSEGKRLTVITAPVAGLATTIIGHTGQSVDINQPIMSILPSGTRLQAELYAPSKSIGFVKVGDPVELRFEAYPYQKYGIYTGRVTLISRTALTSAELTGISELLSQRNDPTDKGAPLYRITVDLDSQFVMVDGRTEPLQAGMMLEASVMQETRRLYEWVLEPLYALWGNPDQEAPK